MKINKHLPKHWWWLFRFGVMTIAAILLRPLIKKSKRNVIVFYGHKLNGNLKGIHDEMANGANKNIAYHFLSMDKNYVNELKLGGIHSLDATSLKTAFTLAKTKVFITDHGLHWLVLFLKFTDAKFADVWHGIPFKGFDRNDFKVQHTYNEIWLTSRRLRELYVEKFGFEIERLHITGYARTDVLITKSTDTQAIKQALNIDPDVKVILFAPTWQQDSNNRSIFPFDCHESDFLTPLNQLCQTLDCIAILRTHLNSSDQLSESYSNIRLAPHSILPNTEDLLLASDLLICDWSSIAFDFLLLNRPTIFLEVPAPFQKGFSLPPDYRFGKIVINTDQLWLSIDKYIKEPSIYEQEFRQKYLDIQRELYDETADGKASERCVQRLIDLFQNE